MIQGSYERAILPLSYEHNILAPPTILTTFAYRVCICSTFSYTPMGNNNILYTQKILDIWILIMLFTKSKYLKRLLSYSKSPTEVYYEMPYYQMTPNFVTF